MDWLQGKQVALAGKLSSMTRNEAADLISEHGGQIASLTRDTAFLVVGEKSWPVQADGRLNSQVQKAQRLQKEGAAVSILTEQELLAKLNGSVDGVRRLYTLSELIDLLKIPRVRFRAWMQAGLIHSIENKHGIAYFDFGQVSGAKTLFELTNAGVSVATLRRSLEQLKTWRKDVDQPMEQLALLEKNGHLLLRIEEGLVEPSGQMCFDFGDEGDILSVQPTTVEGWFHQGIQNEEEGFLQDAAEAYRSALLLGGPDCDVAFNLANVLVELGSKQEACERYRQVVELDPGYAEAWNNLGIVLIELGQSREAISALHRAIALNYADAHYNLADLLDNLGQKAAAIEHWRACARHDPLSPHGKYARAKLG